MEQEREEEPSADAKAAQRAETGSKPRLTSQELLAGRPEIEIEHDGAIYRLRLTKAGKLILHK